MNTCISISEGWQVPDEEDLRIIASIDLKPESSILKSTAS